MKQKVVIIGQGFTGRLSIARSVAEIGCEAIIIALVSYKKDGKTLRSHKPIDGYSKCVSRVYYCGMNDEQGLVSILLEKCADDEQKVVIIPDNDFSAAVIDKNKSVLENKFLFPRMINHQESVIDWMDKVKQKALAKEVGLNVVESQLIEVNNGSYKIPQAINYPCFVKPLVSVVGGKSGLKRCANETALQKHIDVVIQKYQNVKLLVEDFKTIDTEYALLGYANGNDVFIPGILQLISIAHGGHFGVAIKGEIMPVDGFENIVELFKTFVRRVSFQGIFDIDFFLSDGILYFGELNLRFGGSGYAYTKMGTNLPAIMVKDLKGDDVSGMMKEVDKKAVYVNERMCIDEWYSNYISIDEYYKILQSSDISFVNDANDIGPQKALNKEFQKRRIKRTIKKCLGMH
ncbi:MAG: ATP-grasp domain-containing protein [Prevotella sp.]|nr:ATP-grasp domain-containing protein [Prevotella sp.]